MLKTRVLTAAVFGPLFVLGLLYLPDSWFALLVGLIILLGAWEWPPISGHGSVRERILSMAGATVLMIAVYLGSDLIGQVLLVVACAFWIVVTVYLWKHRRLAPFAWPKLYRWISGALALIPAWLAMTILQSNDPGSALLLVLLIWAADTGAYFVGRRWGTHQLAPAISARKTLEGLWGGLGAVAAVAIGFGVWWRLEAGHLAALVCLSMVAALMSVSGDLLESNWKRLANLKDSSGLLPGHGGVLDRIDSMTAAAPFFALGWLWWFSSATT